MFPTLTVTSIFYLCFIVLAVWGVSQAWLSQSRTETIHPFKSFVHLLAFYLSYLLIPLLFFSIYAGYIGKFSLHESIFIFLLSALLIYARFIEPHRVHVQHIQYSLGQEKTFTQPIKVALLADLHIGLFSGHERQLKTIVKKINLAQPDFVVVAGDWTYEPENKLVEELAILKQIEAPVYSVNGNHDEQYPGPPIQALLASALEANNVMDIEGKIVEFDDFRLIGVGDLWAGKADMRYMPDLPQDKPWLILSHNPDTVDMVPQLPTRPLMLSGHTHGGQVELPWLTSYVMKKVSILGHKRGLYQHAGGLRGEAPRRSNAHRVGGVEVERVRCDHRDPDRPCNDRRQLVERRAHRMAESQAVEEEGRQGRQEGNHGHHRRQEDRDFRWHLRCLMANRCLRSHCRTVASKKVVTPQLPSLLAAVECPTDDRSVHRRSASNAHRVGGRSP